MQPAAILSTLASVGREITAERAEAVSIALATNPDLGAAIAQANTDDAFGLLGDLLAYRAAKVENASPAALVARLNDEARDLEARAAYFAKQETDFAGRIAYCRAHNITDLADLLEISRASSARLVTKHADAALSKREAADLLKARVERMGALLQVAS